MTPFLLFPKTKKRGMDSHPPLLTALAGAPRLAAAPKHMSDRRPVS